MLPRNPSDPWRDDGDTSRQCCDGRCYQLNASQGGSCPRQRHGPASNDEISERRYLAKFAVWIAIGALGLWAVFDPLGMLNLIEGAMR